MIKITKIKEIGNFSIFKDFYWHQSLELGNNKTYDFKDINIFYGRNYSGKTSLSKIIRSLQKQDTPPRYDNPSFKIELSDGSIISQNNLTAFTHPVHVYNSDFVKENLKFIHDENANIESFSVTLGGENQQILDRIQELKSELGSNEDNIKSGLYLNIHNKNNEIKNATENHSTKNRDLEKLLTDRATRNSDSIKNQHSLFGDINYNVTKLKNEITEVLSSSFQILTEEQISIKKTLISQNELPKPPELSTYTLNFSQLIEITNEILKTVVGGSNKIEELQNNPSLNSWVQTGHSLHKNRTHCAFCVNEISAIRHQELAQHFDHETQNLQSRISKGIGHLTSLLDGENFKINFDINQYYTQYHAELSQLKIDLQSTLDQQKKSVEEIIRILEQKNGKLFTELEATYPQDHSVEIKTILGKISKIRSECIQQNTQLATQQKEAKNALRLNHVYHFLQDINYAQLKIDLDLAFQEIDPLEQALGILNTRKTAIEGEIKSEEDKLKSEGEACTRINNILNHDFGHQALSLQAIENAHAQNIHFEIQRNGAKAHNLSEGEQSLISFCYFLAKIQDDLDQDKNPIIWIDDPICSLDSNHIFFIYSLINEKICLYGRFSQLFISTHNLDFLKYLKRLNKKVQRNEKNIDLQVAKYHISRSATNSQIKQMPKYLSEYATEFNYLFKQIHICASTDILSDENHTVFYNFSNNARKFIEIYSFFKFPNYFKYDDDRLKNFWNDEIYRLFIGRINNEYSHCAGVLERGMSLMDVPEMHRVAKAIILKVKEDTQQYDALLESIST